MNAYPGCNDFDTHCPIIYRRDLFPVLDMPRFGIGIKTAYCTTNNIAGEYCPDCKIAQPLNEVQILSTISGRMYFSIGDFAFLGAIEKVLHGLWGEKSKYEK